MDLSKIAATCRACPFVDACDHKEMEEVFINNPDVDIKVGVDWAKGPDFTSEMTLSVKPETIIFSELNSNRSLVDRLTDKMRLFEQLYGG